jgi:uncharacterized protein involved in outer membrane biogenesis
VQNLAIADDPRFSPDSPFAKAQELDVSVKLPPLVHKQVETSSLSLERPSVNLIRNQSGVWNFASIVQTDEQKPTSSSQQQFSIGELKMEGGQISLLDQAQSKTLSIYDHIDVTLTNLSGNQAFTVEAAAHMVGAGTQAVTLQGVGGPRALGLRYLLGPINLMRHPNLGNCPEFRD